MKYTKTLALGLMVAILPVGCGPQSGSPKGPGGEQGSVKANGKKSDHAHGAGPHGGVVFDLGKYHGEFTVDHKKQEATIHVLGLDEKTPAPVTAEKLDLHIKSPAFEVELKPVPLEGEAKGKSSRFVGKHEKLGKEQEFEGTVIGLLDGKPTQGEFKEEPEPKK
jgi:hypothetical protein